MIGLAQILDVARCISTHLIFPSLRDGPLPLRPKGGEAFSPPLAIVF
jgi:hypothetical protein